MGLVREGYSHHLIQRQIRHGQCLNTRAAQLTLQQWRRQKRSARVAAVTLCVLLVSQLFYRFFWSGDAPLIALASLKPRSSYALARDGVYDRCIGIQNTRARPTEAALSQLRANDLNATA